MKPIKISEDTKIKLFQKFVEKFKKELDNFESNVNETKFSFSFSVDDVAKEKVTILFSQSAYLRMQALVDFFDTEVGWYGLVDKISDKLYRVYDVKVCKQYVDGAKVDTEDDDTLEFFNSLTDDEAEHMHFQAHSHVKMGTGASSVDLQNQADVVHNMGKSGYYIFQIWNKNNDINTYLYDLDNNIFYDKKDIIIEVEDDEGTLSDYLASVVDLVQEKKTFPVYEYKKGKKDKKNETQYLGGYWDGVNYPNYERWDY